MRRWFPAAAVGIVALAGCGTSTTAGQGSAAQLTPPHVTSSADFPSAASTPAATPPSSSAPASGPSSAGPASSEPSSAAPTSPARNGVVPAGFVGEWDGHSRSLVVRSDGSVAIDFRTYVQCTATVHTGCDRVVGNAIVDGGHVTGRVTHVMDATTVTVTVTATTVPSIVPLGTFRLGHDLKHHAVAPFGNKLDGVPFCGAGAPTGYCGA